MAKCGHCGSTIFGGVRGGNDRFCNNKCLQNAYILTVSQEIPAEMMDKKVEEVFRGNCPKCQARGPVDIHKVHSVWSALILTRWVSTPQVSCRSCATKSQLGGLVFSLFCGWWGFPWGLILTPVQITRNIFGMCGGPDPSRPSADLRKLIQVNLGAQLIASSQQKSMGNQPPVLPR